MVFPEKRSVRNRSVEMLALQVTVVLVVLLMVFAFRNGNGGGAVAPAFGGGGGTPFSFFPNMGQNDPVVQYSAQQAGSQVGFLENGMLLSWVETAETDPIIGQLTVDFLGADTAQIQSENLLPGVVNFLQGNDPSKWQSNIPTYGQVAYEGLYPGVDLTFSGSGQALLATFELETGATLNGIGWRFGDGTVVVTESGGLAIEVAGQSLPVQLARPEAWAIVAGEKVPVAVEYVLGEDGAVGLTTTQARGNGPMSVMLPVLLPGGEGQDIGGGIAVDGNGNFYITGATTSSDLPTMNPLQPYTAGWDVFVSKFSADGSSLLFSTFLGGNDSDWFSNLAVDDAGAMYLTGYTDSVDFPLVNPYQATNNGPGDAFISVIAPDGSSLTYSSYFGGSNGENGLEIYPIGDDILLIGATSSSDFPTQNALQPIYGGNRDAFFTRLDPGTNTLVFSSFLGGSMDEVPHGLAVDGSGNFVFAGQTLSDDFPTVNPLQANRAGNWDIFVTAVDSSGSALQFSTYLGGSDADDSQGVGLDGAGNIHLAGGSISNDFPLVNPFPVANPPGEDIVVATLSPDGSNLLFSGLLGGDDIDRAIDLAVDNAGNKYMVGLTSSDDFPLQSPVQTSQLGTWDLFVTKVDGSNNLAFSTYLGGSKSDTGVSIAVDNDQNFYTLGDTLSTNFPTANAYQPGYRGGAGDVVVTKFNGTDYSMDFSTFFGGGPYPSNPTAVSLSDFGGQSDGLGNLLLLFGGLALVLVLGLGFGAYRRRMTE